MEDKSNIWKSIGKWLLAVVVVGSGYWLFASPEQNEKSVPQNNIRPSPYTKTDSPIKTRSPATGDRDCTDFSTHNQAQTFFEDEGPGDPHGLDRDDDGVACETLP